MLKMKLEINSIQFAEFTCTKKSYFQGTSCIIYNKITPDSVLVTIVATTAKISHPVSVFSKDFMPKKSPPINNSKEYKNQTQWLVFIVNTAH